jgi:DNA-binding MarR family transcriptional regulator
VTTTAEPDYRALLAFRVALRRFIRWSEGEAEGAGLTPAQHQLLVAVKGDDDPRGPTIGDVAQHLLLRHHSAVELVNRAQASGLVTRQRDDQDGRIVRLRLTPSGEDKLRRLSQLHVDELRQLEPLLRHLVDGSGSAGDLPLT